MAILVAPIIFAMYDYSDMLNLNLPPDRPYGFGCGMWEDWVYQLIKFDCPLFMDVPNAMLFSYVNTESWPSLD